MRGGLTLDFVGLVMAGGKGSRLGLNIEKPLLEICGVTMLERVIAALRDSKFIERIFISVTKWTPRTKIKAKGLGVILETSGQGYVNDLREALKIIWRVYGHKNVVVVNADLPLLKGFVIDEAVKHYVNVRPEALTVVVSFDEYRKLGFDADYSFIHEGMLVVPVGVNIIRADLISDEVKPLKERVYLSRYTKLLINVNTIDDAKRVLDLLRSQRACTL